MVKKLKTALITAGGAGIGRAVADCFAESGYNVHVCDIKSDLIEAISEEDNQITGSVCDVGEPDQVKQLIDQFLRKYSGADVLVNNAGIPGPSVKLEDIDLKDWEEAIKVNLTGTFLCSKSAIELLKESGGGSIINIGSTSSFMGTPLRSAYTASKWGLIGLTKTWAMEYGKDKIRVNTVCPTSVSGERIEGVIERDAEYRKIDPEKIRQAYLDQTSLKTFIDSEEIVGMVVYLLSPLAKNISGQMMVIDGHTETLAMPEFSEE